MYDQIEYVLSSYFNVAIAGSNVEADKSLSRSIAENRDFARTLREELQAALVDEDYSWAHAFESNEVDFFSSEEEARAYAKKRLWDPFFG